MLWTADKTVMSAYDNVKPNLPKEDIEMNEEH